MRSFHHSRARILFEVFCAFGISASCVEAWMQTYASAFVPAAVIAALYGLVHAFDLVRRNPAADEPVESAERVTDNQGDLLVYLAAEEPESVIDDEPELTLTTEQVEPEVAEPAQEAVLELAEPVQQAEPDVPELVQEAMPEMVEPVQEAEPEVIEPVQEAEVAELAPDEPEYSPVAPLFEAEPFVRKQRAAFGRRRAG